MKPNLLALLLPLFGLLASPGTVAAQDKPAKAPTKAVERIAEIQYEIAVPLKEITGFKEGMPLAKFLKALEGMLPGEKKISFQIDAEAFGKDFPRVANATVRLPRMLNVSPVTTLRRALAQVSKVVEVDFAIRPSGVVITRPRLAVHRMTYDINLIVRELPRLLPFMQKQSGDSYRLNDSSDAAAVLVRFLMNEVALRPWETIQVLNGNRLAVVASPTIQGEIDDLLVCLRRLTDTAVVMNARLYEVDRAFFNHHIAPLVARVQGADNPPVIFRIDGPLFKKMSRQKLLLESDNARIRPDQEAPFLARQSVFRFAAGPHPSKANRVLIGTGLAGVSFKVRPLVSPDRRYLRLRISQAVAQLVGIDKAKVLDAAGKEIEVESPNVRKATATETVQLPDGAPILMLVSYRPPGKEGADKVWLLVARPFIWIEEEARIYRQMGQEWSPQYVWKSDLPEEEKPPPPPPPLPSTDEVRDILQAVLTDVLASPDLKGTLNFYGTAKDRTFTLIDGDKLGWPRHFRPETHGFRQVEVKHDPFVNRRRVLGIRLEKFDVKQKKAGLFDTPIEVCLFNAGGSANGAVIGGCSLFYTAKRVGKRWTVQCQGLLDP